MCVCVCVCVCVCALARVIRLMAQVPGKDNYLGKIHDDVFDLNKMDVLAANDTKLNVAYHYRWYRVIWINSLNGSID